MKLFDSWKDGQVPKGDQIRKGSGERLEEGGEDGGEHEWEGSCKR